jgi:predicted transporter
VVVAVFVFGMKHGRCIGSARADESMQGLMKACKHVLKYCIGAAADYLVFICMQYGLG